MKPLLVLIAASMFAFMAKGQSVESTTGRPPLTEKRKTSETEEAKRKAELERQLILRKAEMQRQAATMRREVLTIDTNQLGKALQELRTTKAGEKHGDFWLPGEFQKERKRKAHERSFEGSPSPK